MKCVTLKPRENSQKGHAMLELALSAAVMVSFLAGTFQFGYTFYVYNQLVTAVGNGARYAATRAYRSATAQDIEKGASAIRNMVVFGDARPAQDAVPAVANLTTNQVDVRWTTDPAGAPTAVDVSIREFSVNAVFKTLTFTGRPGVEFPYVGRYAPTESEPDPSGSKPGPLREQTGSKQ
jgi:Flp pilus assembly protein TadG